MQNRKLTILIHDQNLFRIWYFVSSSHHFKLFLKLKSELTSLIRTGNVCSKQHFTIILRRNIHNRIDETLFINQKLALKICYLTVYETIFIEISIFVVNPENHHISCNRILNPFTALPRINEVELEDKLDLTICISFAMSDKPDDTRWDILMKIYVAIQSRLINGRLILIQLVISL